MWLIDQEKGFHSEAFCHVGAVNKIRITALSVSEPQTYALHTLHARR
ncbi:hypothetical protein VCHC81A2_1257, partial [Vibrio cholerae HC-81A2]